jgi:hypothetical protein
MENFRKDLSEIYQHDLELARALKAMLDHVWESIRNWIYERLGWKPPGATEGGLEGLRWRPGPRGGGVYALPDTFSLGDIARRLNPPRANLPLSFPVPREPPPPEGAAGMPPGGTTLMPSSPAAAGAALMPMSFTPPFQQTEGPDLHAQRRELGAIINAAIQTGGTREGRPIIVSLNIDGQRISEALSTQLAAMMEQPGQAPYHDGWRGWQPPDQQMTTT